MFFQRNFEDKHAKDENYCKARDHCHYTGEYGGAIDEGQFICLRENTERYTNFSIPIKKLQKFIERRKNHKKIIL